MIRRLTGNILETTEDSVVLDVQGVGYHIYTHHTSGEIRPGVTHTYHVYLSVRETALDLYGFTSESTLEMFELLLTIPKIGPKSALQILSQADISSIVSATNAQDPSLLTKLSGIGKKTAEKIVDGLRDKVAQFGDLPDAATTPEQTEALDTLVALGYSIPDAREALKHVDGQLPLQEQIKTALQQL